ncbi:hypothetical protein [Rhodococcus sp. OK302]|uniref:hypothetical protein n=1 Tax=Rhodococcus sp. OK302 TaxID=1882769 RepID=UPI000B93DE21|nr:hypothetical protein [Rhodococcus sp. OK302]OYD67497.1 hypothetical protein BDB13_1021 [Rhodococcus sp. OK302]
MGTFAADIAELEKLGGVLHGLADEAAQLSVGPPAGGASGVNGSFGSWFNSNSMPSEPLPFTPMFGDPSAGSSSSVLSSYLEASSISSELIDGVLVPSLTERLGEAGDIMVNVAEQFRSRDEQSAADLATTYTSATGDWNTQDSIE